MQLTEDKKTGILYRPETFDLYIVRETKSYFPMGLKSSDRVVDIGGHIGCFSSRAKTECKDCQIISFEPEESNFQVNSENSKKFNYDVLRAAITADELDGQKIKLYVNAKKNNALHSTVPTRGRECQEVDAIGFSTLLSDVNPTVIKCDIESAEFDLPWNKIKDSAVQMVIMELHLLKKNSREKAKNLIDLFKEMKFEVKNSPKIDGQNWTTLAKFGRIQ